MSFLSTGPSIGALASGSLGSEPGYEILLISLVCIVLYGMTRMTRRQDS